MPRIMCNRLSRWFGAVRRRSGSRGLLSGGICASDRFSVRECKGVFGRPEIISARPPRLGLAVMPCSDILLGVAEVGFSAAEGVNPAEVVIRPAQRLLE